MKVYDIYNARIKDYISEEGISFDEMIFSRFFNDVINSSNISSIRTDNYGDAGIDYIFFSLNRNVIYELSDLDDLDTDFGRKEKGILDCYMIQIKDTKKLDSRVPNNLLEFVENLRKSNRPDHYNDQIISCMELYDSLIERLVLNVKVRFHFFYFSKAERKQINSATDLVGRFETLKEIVEEIDYVDDVEYTLISINDITDELSKDGSFSYKFRKIEKFEAETEENENGYETKSVIALIPITQYYHFISAAENKINEKLFDSNIRDFKGKSSVNKDIIETLSNNKKMDFWWLNNGITITVEEINESQSAKTIELINPQIVNGLQTSYSIFQYYQENKDLLEKEERKVFVKILKIDNEDDELDVIVATNSQNEIRDKDIHANDTVQKNIEMFFRTFNKYYQRKDKYYTNRHKKKKDIIRLDDLAKYINTIYLKDPAGTRNNPGKLVKGTKYDSIFRVDDENQDYNRYKLSYDIYNKISELLKGVMKLDEDLFDKNTFIHHVVYCTICMKLKNVDYTPQQLELLDINSITENDVNDVLEMIVETLIINRIPKTQIIKQIKSQAFTQKLNQHMISKFRG